MKFNCTVDINADIDTITASFFNTEEMIVYQDGFQSKTLLSGVDGKEGAKSKIKYKRLELIETIITNNLPQEFLALYEHKHTTNTMKVNFEPLSQNKTRYTTEIEYTQLNGIVINVIAKLFPSLFKKQVEKWLKQFKIHVESK